jgi:tetratricopeptide (TPR) repeat protein
LSKFDLRLAWLGGLIFAIHPIQVESVAWIAELKNTLSLPPFLLAMCAWIDFDARGKRRDYFLALGFFLVAMLCKPTMAMFPVVILLFAWWKRGRIGWRDARVSAPFFVVSLVLGFVTVWFLHHHAQGGDPVPLGGFFSRLACAGLSLSFYFSTCFLPVGLLPIYPKWVVDPPTLAQFLPWPILLAVIFWLWARRGSWGRQALLGLGFFLINLAPFIGFNAASYMTFTWVMDHILYIPIIGLIGLTVAALSRMEKQLPASFRPCVIGLVTVALALLALESHDYAKIFVNEETFWTYELRHNPDAFLAHNNLGYVFQKAGRQPEAISEFEEALRLDPDYYVALNNLGNSLLQTGRVPEALERYEQALRLKPENAVTHNNLGNALTRSGRMPEALEHYQEAMRLDPDSTDVRNNLGFALQTAGRMDEAEEQYNQALKLDPGYAKAHNNLGNIYYQTGRFPEAIAQFEQALRLNPDYAEAHNNFGNVLSQTGRVPEAMDQFTQALRLDPDYPEAHYDLATVLLQTGRVSEAIEQYEAALRLKPDYAEAHNNLGTALAQTGRLPEAIAQFEQALQLQPDNAEAHNNLGHALQQTGRLSEAMEQFEEALRLKPDFAAARSNLVKVQALLKTAPAKN